ncbi:MAG: outer membrane beta-barrel protein [Bacteroidetes bacterium]|nr:outer membrane beta-barrel protein [Bacteroidota bacterium]
MKKILSFSLLVLFCTGLFAQEKSGSKDMKNFRFGVTALPSLVSYKPDDLKKFEKGGTTFRFGVLVNAEYSFSGNFALGFGIGIGSCGGKIKFIDSTHYYVNDGEIIQVKDTSNILTGKIEQFLLKTRTYKASYYSIPISLKMRTNEIGYMRYFVEPRLNINIRKKVRADDDVVNWNSTNAVKEENLDITKDMALLKISATLSAGGEYYLSGSTAFVFAIGYDYGLSNAVQKESGNLLRTKDNVVKPLEQKFNQNGIVLSLGILF